MSKEFVQSEKKESKKSLNKIEESVRKLRQIQMY